MTELTDLTFEKLMLHSQSLQTNPEMSWGHNIRNAIFSEYSMVHSGPSISAHPRSSQRRDFSEIGDRRSHHAPLLSLSSSLRAGFMVFSLW